MPSFTVFTIPNFFHRGQSRTSRTSPPLMFLATVPPRLSPTTTLGLLLIELDLSDADGLLEVVVGQLRIDDNVAVLG